MAMQDYFYECNKMTYEETPDGLGGLETREVLGESFQGLAVIRSTSEQLVGALRGQEDVAYNLHCGADVDLHKDDRVTFVVGGERKFLRLTDEAHINTERSHQTHWKSFSAVSYVPTNEVTE